MSTRTNTSKPVSDVTLPRSYDQWCPIAVGLDLLGDRWTLLILRELMMGDRRFTDLRRALPGLAPNLLTERLHTLGDIGLIVTAELAPPAARSVYRLTDEGRAAAPVLRSLARFGARHLAGEPGPTMNAVRAANAFLIPWYRPTATPLLARLNVTSAARPDPTSVDLRLDRRVHITSVDDATDTDVAVSLVTTIEALAEARRTDQPLADAPTGTKRGVATFRAAFSL